MIHLILSNSNCKCENNYFNNDINKLDTDIVNELTEIIDFLLSFNDLKEITDKEIKELYERNNDNMVNITIFSKRLFMIDNYIKYIKISVLDDLNKCIYLIYNALIRYNKYCNTMIIIHKRYIYENTNTLKLKEKIDKNKNAINKPNFDKYSDEEIKREYNRRYKIDD